MKKASFVLLLLFAGCHTGSSGTPAPTASSSAPEPPPQKESREPIAVPQKSIQAAAMIFHPTLPIVGQIDGERCDLWALDVGLYRGQLSRAVCEGWKPKPREVPEKISNGTPLIEPPTRDPDDPAQEAVGKLVATWSPDGKRIATARKGGGEVRVWNLDSGALESTTAIPRQQGPADPRIEDLAFSADGKLFAAVLPVGAYSWDPSVTGSAPKAIPTELRAQRLWLDPAARYLGGSGTIPTQRSIGRMTSVVSLSDGAEKLSRRTTDALEAALSGIKTSAIWAASGNVVYAIERTPIQLEACEDESLLVTAIDLEKGLVKHRNFERADFHLAGAAPGGRSLLLSVTVLGACEEHEPPESHESSTPLTELWSLDEGKALWSAPIKAKSIAWSSQGDKVALDDGKTREVRSIRDGKKVPASAKKEEWVEDKRGLDTKDASSRFELLPGLAVRRLSDGEVLHIDERRGAWTDRYAFAKSPPEEWVFREGSDVLGGKLVRVKEATFLAPTPDLLTLFISGKPLPSVNVESGR